MSLRDRLQQEKGAKAAERAAQEAEAAQQRAAELKGQFQVLVERNAELETLESHVKGATENVSQAKGTLKKERGNLRELHKDSIDEVTGEALLPKPAELIQSEEYKGEEELQQYEQAREGFRGAAKEAKGVREALTAFGIEDASTMLPGQIEAVLKEQRETLQKETEEFLLEHPEVDPERAAEVRERRVDEKAEYFDKKKYQLWGESGNQFRENSSASFSKGVEAATGALLKSDRDIREYIDVLRATEEKGEGISSVTTEALSRSVARRLLEADTDDNKLLKSFAKEYPDVVTGRENVLRSEVQARAEQAVAQSPEVRAVAESIVDLAKRLETYQSIPKRRREMAARNAAIDSRLGVDEYARDPSILLELRVLDNQSNYRETRENSNKREIESLREAAPLLLRLKQLPDSILDSKIQVTTGGMGARIGITFESKVNNWPEMSKLRESINEATKAIPNLRNQITRVSEMKDGVFGVPKEKKRARADLFDDVKKVSGKDVTNEQEATAALEEVQSQIPVKEARIQALRQEEVAFDESVKPIEKVGALLGEYRFTGTAREYLDLLSKKLPQRLEAAEAEEATLRAEKEESEEKRRQLEEERTSLQGEKAELAASMKDMQELEDRLGHELYTKHLISSRPAPR